MRIELLEKGLTTCYHLTNKLDTSGQAAQKAQFFPRGPGRHSEEASRTQTQAGPQRLRPATPAAGCNLPPSRPACRALGRAPGCLGERLAGSKTQRP